MHTKEFRKALASFLTRAFRANFSQSLNVQERTPEAETQERTKMQKKSQVFCFPIITVHDFKQWVFLLVAEAVFRSSMHAPAFLCLTKSKELGPLPTPAYFLNFCCAPNLCRSV